MKNTIILSFILLFVFSCGKKEVKIDDKQEVIETTTQKDATDQFNKEVEEVQQTPKLLFTVQIAALKNDNENLRTKTNVSLYEENNLTKYRLGKFETYQEARIYRLQILDTYKDAFVQALKNNKPIPIKEALQE